MCESNRSHLRGNRTLKPFSQLATRHLVVHEAITINEPCALPLSPPKGGSKREFLHLALPFISLLQVIVDTSSSVCG